MSGNNQVLLPLSGEVREMRGARREADMLCLQVTSEAENTVIPLCPSWYIPLGYLPRPRLACMFW